MYGCVYIPRDMILWFTDRKETVLLVFVCTHIARVVMHQHTHDQYNIDSDESL